MKEHTDPIGTTLSAAARVVRLLRAALRIPMSVRIGAAIFIALGVGAYSIVQQAIEHLENKNLCDLHEVPLYGPDDLSAR
jgi:hypothetical protein